MKKFRTKPVLIISLILAFLYLPTVIIAQNVMFTLDKDDAKIGDFIKARLTVQGAKPNEVTWPAFEDKIGDLYLIKADTLNAEKSQEFGGATVEYTVAAYDTGSFSLGDVDFEVNGNHVSVEGGSVHIGSVLKAPSDTLFAPLKPQADLSWTLADILEIAWPWAAGLVGAILIYLLIRWWLKSRLKEEEGEKAIPLVPPYEEAIEALREFRLDNPFGRGDIKGHVTGLTAIVKRLLQRVHEDPVQEMTTYEVNRWLVNTRVRCDEEMLRQMLNQADVVKFAKGVITSEIAESHVNTTAEIIEAYKPGSEIIEVEIPAENEIVVEKQPELIPDSIKIETSDISEEVLSADYEEKLLNPDEKSSPVNQNLPEGWEKYAPGNSRREGDQ